MIGTGVEQGRRGVSEVALGHEVVSLNNSIEVSSVDTDGHAHDEVLGTFGNTIVQTKEVRAFESLESEARAIGFVSMSDQTHGGSSCLTSCSGNHGHR